MTIQFDLRLSGHLLGGGTTADDQIAYLRSNDTAIRKAIKDAGCFRARNSSIFDAIKPHITEITEWRRDAEKVLREIIRRAQAEERQAVYDRAKITTKGRLAGRIGNAPATSHALTSERLSTPPPLQVTSLSQSTSPAAAQRSPSTSDQVPVSSSPSVSRPLTPIPRPTVTTQVWTLELPKSVKDVLMAYVKNGGNAELISLFANIDPDWRTLKLPADLRAAMEWLNALG
jgi:hypothetical protein